MGLMRCCILAPRQALASNALNSPRQPALTDALPTLPTLPTLPHRFIQSYMCSLSYFFSLWPAPLQWELCRLLSAHILARREVALTRGKPPDRLYFVVQGRVRGKRRLFVGMIGRGGARVRCRPVAGEQLYCAVHGRVRGGGPCREDQYVTHHRHEDARAGVRGALTRDKPPGRLCLRLQGPRLAGWVRARHVADIAAPNRRHHNVPQPLYHSCTAARAACAPSSRVLQLDVRLPVPSPGGGREERTLAVLTRGNTAGESILLVGQTAELWRTSLKGCTGRPCSRVTPPGL